MTIDEFLKMCREREFENLISFLSSDVKDLSTKIIASAVIGQYHPDKKIAQECGLDVWSKQLSPNSVSAMLSLFTSAVDLFDFTRAYQFARAENLLNDEKVANDIKAYVLAHKMILGQCLSADKIPQESRVVIAEIFGDIGMGKKQKEVYFTKKFAEHAKARIAFLKARDQVKQELMNVFGFKEHEFNVYFNEPSKMNEIETQMMGGEGELSIYNKNASKEWMKKIAETLSDAGISANYYDMRFMYGEDAAYGIQIFCPAQAVVQKLQELKENMQKADKNNLNGLGFFKAVDDLQVLAKMPKENENLPMQGLTK